MRRDPPTPSTPTPFGRPLCPPSPPVAVLILTHLLVMPLGCPRSSARRAQRQHTEDRQREQEEQEGERCMHPSG
eukprot:4024533-Pyramimonas_sp.AAC.1